LLQAAVQVVADLSVVVAVLVDIAQDHLLFYLHLLL
jgi:hypothetical protein